VGFLIKKDVQQCYSVLAARGGEKCCRVQAWSSTSPLAATRHPIPDQEFAVNQSRDKKRPPVNRYRNPKSALCLLVGPITDMKRNAQSRRAKSARQAGAI